MYVCLMQRYLHYLIFVFTYTSISISLIPIHALHLQSYWNHTKEISGRFKDPARVDLAVLRKIVNFWRFQNGSVNLLGITSKESWFLISYIMLLKHVYMGWKFQRTLKLDISFSLEHFFISVAIFTKVVSAPLVPASYLGLNTLKISNFMCSSFFSY